MPFCDYIHDISILLTRFFGGPISCAARMIAEVSNGFTAAILRRMAVELSGTSSSRKMFLCFSMTGFTYESFDYY